MWFAESFFEPSFRLRSPIVLRGHSPVVHRLSEFRLSCRLNIHSLGTLLRSVGERGENFRLRCGGEAERRWHRIAKVVFELGFLLRLGEQNGTLGSNRPAQIVVRFDEPRCEKGQMREAATDEHFGSLRNAAAEAQIKAGNCAAALDVFPV